MAPPPLFGLLPLAGVIFALFSSFKYGYVRHDAHELAATSRTAAHCARRCRQSPSPGRGQTGPKALLLTSLATIFALCFSLATLARYSPGGYLPTLADTLGMRSLAAPFAVIQGNQPFVRAQETYYSGLRAPLSPSPP